MKTRKVIAASWSRNGDSMGTLVDEGIMTKEYRFNTFTKTADIHWTLHENAGVVIDNGNQILKPGDTVVWEK